MVKIYSWVKIKYYAKLHDENKKTRNNANITISHETTRKRKQIGHEI